MSPRSSAVFLLAATTLFWLSWVIMPAVGITDASLILDLVADNRPEVLLSTVLQLSSAACYAPALLGLVLHPGVEDVRAVFVGAALLLVGAMGSAADAVFHLLAFHMTASGADRAALLPVMEAMQGPGLLLLAPMIAAFFVGTFVLAVGWSRAGLARTRPARCVAFAITVAALASVAGSGPLMPGRLVGLAVLTVPCAFQLRLALGLLHRPHPADYLEPAPLT